LTLFGDNAYVSAPYIVVPYKGERVGGTKDVFNFFHSKLRIKIECAFGMLAHRWAILRSPLSNQFSCEGQIALVISLCKLQNYCMGEQDKCLDLCASDPASVAGNGEVYIECNPHQIVNDEHFVEKFIPELTGVGHQFDDVEDEEIRRAHFDMRAKLHRQVVSKMIHRPVFQRR